LVAIAISIVISFAAFALSVFTWRERRQNDRRDLFLKVHERLIDLDLQRGRRILGLSVHTPEDAWELLHDRPDDYELVSRALSMLDVAALYVERGFIDRSLFVAEWGDVYSGLQKASAMLVAQRAHRSSTYSTWSWPHFQRLASEINGSIPEHDSSTTVN
jgi:hypothetical protein